MSGQAVTPVCGKTYRVASKEEDSCCHKGGGDSVKISGVRVGMKKVGGPSFEKSQKLQDTV